MHWYVGLGYCIPAPSQEEAEIIARRGTARDFARLREQPDLYNESTRKELSWCLSHPIEMRRRCELDSLPPL